MIPTLWQIELSVVLAAAVAWLLTPWAMRVAKGVGAVDHPEARRVHTSPTPRCGGIAILAGLSLAVAICLACGALPLSRQVVGVLLGGAAISLMGLADDIYALPALLRLCFQIVVAVAVVMFFRIRIEVLSSFGGHASPYIYLRWLTVPLTVLWIVALTNAFNWIDGLDGLAAGISALVMMTLVLMALKTPPGGGTSLVVLVAAAATGACLGFLRFNLSPAQIFMGDSGAMFLGFVVACLSVIGAFKKATLVVLVPPLACGVVLYDFASTLLLRWRKGKPLHVPDRLHVHHRLLDRGLSQQRVVLVLYATTGLLCALALLVVGK